MVTRVHKSLLATKGMMVRPAFAERSIVGALLNVTIHHYDARTAVTTVHRIEQREVEKGE